MDEKKIELIQALDDFYAEIWTGISGQDMLYGLRKFPDFQQEDYINDGWSYEEIKQHIMDSESNNLIADLEDYLLSAYNYQEVYEITHGYLYINPFETLVTLLSGFLDFLYNIKFMLGGDEKYDEG